MRGPRTLVQVLLPLYDDAGREFPRAAYADLRRRLTETFGGLTAYSRAPVEGWWQPDGERPAQRDDLVIFEVMAERLDADWWRDLKRSLEARFRQDAIVVRAQAVELL
jgi:hypothetical protein